MVYSLRALRTYGAYQMIFRETVYVVIEILSVNLLAIECMQSGSLVPLDCRWHAWSLSHNGKRHGAIHKLVVEYIASIRAFKVTGT